MTPGELNELKLRWDRLQALVRKYGVMAMASIPNEQWEQLILRDVPTLLEELEAHRQHLQNHIDLDIPGTA